MSRQLFTKAEIAEENRIRAGGTPATVERMKEKQKEDWLHGIDPVLAKNRIWGSPEKVPTNSSTRKGDTRVPAAIEEYLKSAREYLDVASFRAVHTSIATEQLRIENFAETLTAFHSSTKRQGGEIRSNKCYASQRLSREIRTLEEEVALSFFKLLIDVLPDLYFYEDDLNIGEGLETNSEVSSTTQPMINASAVGGGVTSDSTSFVSATARYFEETIGNTPDEEATTTLTSNDGEAKRMTQTQSRKLKLLSKLDPTTEYHYFTQTFPANEFYLRECLSPSATTSVDVSDDETTRRLEQEVGASLGRYPGRSPERLLGCISFRLNSLRSYWLARTMIQLANTYLGDHRYGRSSIGLTTMENLHQVISTEHARFGNNSLRSFHHGMRKALLHVGGASRCFSDISKELEKIDSSVGEEEERLTNINQDFEGDDVHDSESESTATSAKMQQTTPSPQLRKIEDLRKRQKNLMSQYETRFCYAAGAHPWLPIVTEAPSSACFTSLKEMLIAHKEAQCGSYSLRRQRQRQLEGTTAESPAGDEDSGEEEDEAIPTISLAMQLLHTDCRLVTKLLNQLNLWALATRALQPLLTTLWGPSSSLRGYSAEQEELSKSLADWDIKVRTSLVLQLLDLRGQVPQHVKEARVVHTLSHFDYKTKIEAPFRARCREVSDWVERTQGFLHPDNFWQEALSEFFWITEEEEEEESDKDEEHSRGDEEPASTPPFKTGEMESPSEVVVDTRVALFWMSQQIAGMWYRACAASMNTSLVDTRISDFCFENKDSSRSKSNNFLLQGLSTLNPLALERQLMTDSTRVYRLAAVLRDFSFLLKKSGGVVSKRTEESGEEGADVGETLPSLPRIYVVSREAFEEKKRAAKIAAKAAEEEKERQEKAKASRERDERLKHILRAGSGGVDYTSFLSSTLTSNSPSTPSKPEKKATGSPEKRKLIGSSKAKSTIDEQTQFERQQDAWECSTEAYLRLCGQLAAVFHPGITSEDLEPLLRSIYSDKLTPATEVGQ